MNTDLSLHTITIDSSYADGSLFYGSQYQPSLRTVQGDLEQAIGRYTGEDDVRVTLASRTDRGVHAAGQCGMVKTKSPLSSVDFFRGIDTYLPADLAIRSVLESKDLSWDPRSCSTGKHYRYFLLCGPDRPVLSPLARRAWYVRCAGVIENASIDNVSECGFPWMNLTRMREHGKHLVGQPLDFTAMSNLDKGKTAQNSICFLSSLDIHAEPAESGMMTSVVTIDIIGSRFLYNMVRIIVGTLVDLGLYGYVKKSGACKHTLGEADPKAMQNVLKSRNRAHASQGAPAQGLCLMEVFYNQTGVRWI